MERNEKMNVWIRGNKTNPKGVIKALENLGGKNPGSKGRNDNCIYFINYKGFIDYYNISSLEAYCIMNTFKEIQPKVEVELTDKQLVWCWSDSYFNFGRNIRFYDAIFNCTFNMTTGHRDGLEFRHYEPYEGEWPEWAKEAVKMLQD